MQIFAAADAGDITKQAFLVLHQQQIRCSAGEVHREKWRFGKPFLLTQRCCADMPRLMRGLE